MRRFPARVSRRDVANHLAFMAGGTEMQQAAPRAKRNAAPEADVMSAVKDWARARGDLTLWRNNCGAMEWRPGRWLRYGLCNGSSDFIGLTSLIVTPAMVGKRIAVFTAIEAKAQAGVVSGEQLAFIEAVRDAGGIAGVARSAEEAEEVVGRWRQIHG